MYSSFSDDDLLPLMIQGNDEAFDEVYKRYMYPLYRYIRKSIPLKEDCQEIIQEIFESLWLRHEDLTHVKSLNGYLFTMAKYKVIRYFQHSLVQKKYEEHYRIFEAVYESLPETDRDMESPQRLIERGLLSLPERCQVAVRLRLNENLSNEAIALRMNIKKGTVENYMVTAVQHLRGLYLNAFKAS